MPTGELKIKKSVTDNYLLCSDNYLLCSYFMYQILLKVL